jgi:hypothetical protein
VAAALAGSLVTLLLDPGTSTPSVQQVAIRNASRTSPAPGGSTNWRVVWQGGPRTIYVGPGNGPGTLPAPGWVYLSPASPPGAIWMPAQSPGNWTAVPGCVIYRARIAPFPPGSTRRLKVIRRRQVIIGRVGIVRAARRVSVQIGAMPACRLIHPPRKTKSP